MPHWHSDNDHADHLGRRPRQRKVLVLCVDLPLHGLPCSRAVFSMYLCTASGPCLWAWLSDMMPREAEERSMMVGVCITMYYAVSEWL